MLPSSGFYTPAMHLSVILFPLPEAPSSAVTPASAVKETFSVNPCNRLMMSTVKDMFPPVYFEICFNSLVTIF